MRDSQSDRSTVASRVVDGGGNGGTFGPTEPLDRSYLLRRASRFPFPHLFLDGDPIRLRRERRVSAPFSAIPPLSRDDQN